MTLIETCARLSDHLQGWYNQRKTQYKEIVRRIKPYTSNEINSGELAKAKDEFMFANPECKEFEFDIYYDFVAVDKTYIAGCICGDCDVLSHVTVSGIKVEPIDWKHMRLCAFA